MGCEPFVHVHAIVVFRQDYKQALGSIGLEGCNPNTSCEAITKETAIRSYYTSQHQDYEIPRLLHGLSGHSSNSGETEEIAQQSPIYKILYYTDIEWSVLIRLEVHHMGLA